MTKRKSDKGGRGKLTRTTAEPVPARARGYDASVFDEWCKLIAHGKTQRFAAIGVGVPLTTIRSWMDTRPELLEQLKDAMEIEVQRRLDESDDLPLAIGSGKTDEDAAAGGIHPKAAELKIKQNNWRLSWLDAERFGDKRRVETTGKDGGPIQTEAKQLVTYEFPKNPIVGGDGE